MKAYLLCVVILLGVTISGYAQKEVSDDVPFTFKDRAYAGLGLGGLSLGRSSDQGAYFSIGVGALGGYMLTSNLSAGVGFEYQYTNYSDAGVKNHVYGGYPFVRYNIKNFFLQFDYDLIRYNADSAYGNTSSEGKDERLFGGLGFSHPTRGRTVVNFLVTYDFLYNTSSLFASPIHTRLFFTF